MPLSTPEPLAGCGLGWVWVWVWVIGQDLVPLLVPGCGVGMDGGVDVIVDVGWDGRG